MDTLVALGSTTAFGYSAWILLTGMTGHLYFMEAAAILTLISTGHWLEARMSARASQTLRGLLELSPTTARRQHADGSEAEVALSELKIDDLIVLRPGDRLPLDGAVVTGQSAVDESTLTGESVPVEKGNGSPVYAGTINLNGRMTVRVTAMGEQTALAHVIDAVQRAQSSRAEIQRLGDKVSSVFVPVVVTIAVLAGLWWALAPDAAARVHGWLSQFLWHSTIPAHPVAAGLIIAAAILIVACPCAMGLATPAAIMAGSNVAAARGILIRDGVALEKAGRITVVALDKTGTLTNGKAEVASVWQAGSASAPSALRWAATLAAPSSHPLSLAIARQTAERADVRDWREVRGSGLQAQLPDGSGNDRTLRLGSLTWMQELGVDLQSSDGFTAEWAGQGATIVGLASDKTLLAFFAVKDLLKPGAADVVRQLDRRGLKPCLVTGDHAHTAQSIARQAGIPSDRVFAGVRPDQKAGLILKLQQDGERVAFVGDGINDAPALEQADLGIAVSRASDIARESADIILLNSGIEAVPESLGLARATLATIKQNLFWAFFYNALAVPLAALGFISPMLCAAAMGLSDVIVIGNALRLRHWREH
jgi:Cu+-exporting ATPase